MAYEKTIECIFCRQSIKINIDSCPFCGYKVKKGLAISKLLKNLTLLGLGSIFLLIIFYFNYWPITIALGLSTVYLIYLILVR